MIMDVDCMIVSLKRSSSAPMINKIIATMSVTSPSASAPRDTSSSFNIFSNSPCVQRCSTNSSGNIPRLTPRVSQLRQEECLDVVGREAAHEKEIHSAMQISQSWEDLTIEAEGLSFKDSESLQFKIESRQITKRVFDPLSINLSMSGSSVYSSPSPTRSGLGQRQCYSPSIHAVTWKNNLSPSPTRKAFATRRSLSPIAIRPSCLASVKRKFELEDPAADHQLQPPAKRTSSFLTSAASRLDVAISSPHLGTTSSAGTPESLSSLDSPGFLFRPVGSPSPGLVLPLTTSEDPYSSSCSSSSSSSSSSLSSSSSSASISTATSSFTSTSTSSSTSTSTSISTSTSTSTSTSNSNFNCNSTSASTSTSTSTSDSSRNITSTSSSTTSSSIYSSPFSGANDQLKTIKEIRKERMM